MPSAPLAARAGAAGACSLFTADGAAAFRVSFFGGVPPLPLAFLGIGIPL
jgi:hypothetical protein